MEEKKKTDKAVELDFITSDDLEVIFTDVVQISTSQEAVMLELALRSKDNETATITHKVYMTIPHFLRFVNTCSGLSEELIKKIEEDNDESKS